MIFEPSTLAQLAWLKGELHVSSKVDRFLLASLAGIMHGNANRDGTTRGLSLPMPNTFAMSPGYIRRYVDKHKLVAPRLDVLARLTARVGAMLTKPASFSSGSAWIQDAAGAASQIVRRSPAKLLFTSPPYLEVMKYGKFNWIRLWLLGESQKAVDSNLFSTKSLSKYLDFMSRVLRECRAAIRDDGYVCLVIGDVRHGDDEIDLSSAVADAAVPGSGLRVVGTIFDRLPQGRKVSRIWGKTRGRATKNERILVLRGPRARVPGNLSPSSLAWRGLDS
jgi:site-specific DNA-methyltransferase (adenine-specific)